MSAAGSAAQVPKRKNFTREEKEEVLRHLLAGSNNGVVKQGAYTEAAKKFGCCPETISRLWAKFDQQKKAGVAHPDLENGRKGKSGRKGTSPSKSCAHAYGRSR